jgi:hypothetical protein
MAQLDQNLCLKKERKKNKKERKKMGNKRKRRQD